jgi:hypothetical protein
MRKEAVVAQFQKHSEHLTGRMQENLEKRNNQDSCSMGQDLNQRPPEYKIDVEATKQQS